MSCNFTILAVAIVLAVVSPGFANVTQCYQCDNLYCGDPYDKALGGKMSCSDVFKNAKLFASRLVASDGVGASGGIQGSQVGLNNTEDIETLGASDTNEVIRMRTHAQFFDIQRKIWEFFNKGEIDENTEFVCVKANYNTQYVTRKTYRGCVPKRTKSIATACDFVTQKVGATEIDGCMTCDSNLCNSSDYLRHSILALFIGFLPKLLF